ncbi:MAG: trimethoprim-resistant dihydrofolate reductase DfrA [Candidatus Latescibacteria bacterium]|nr:trimethoprim-resistant dihydrofolate reductase DfrA [Candidatus Latescibacterota bacterium]
MQISLIAARSDNNIIGAGPDIPWRAKGEQLLFKALTYNQWLLVGRKTFESMGILPNRKYAVLTQSAVVRPSERVRVFASVAEALEGMAAVTDHLIVAGGGQIYQRLIDRADTLHLSQVHCQVEGDIVFPAIPAAYQRVFSQTFQSNIDYTYQIWRR